MTNTTLMNRQWRLKSRPEGHAEDDNFEWAEAPVATLEDQAVLVRNLYLSLDPAQRGWMRETRGYRDPIQVGEVIVSSGVGRVVESKHPDYAVGDAVQGSLGWQDYAQISGKELRGLIKLPTNTGQPLYSFLGALGMNGLTAYFGLLDIGKPQAGETLVVSAAAGATGSLVGQIGKIKGCRVIGIAGTDAKCSWLIDELGFDAAINYKTENVRQSLREHCPDKIDIYFDNVGGTILEAALSLINQRGRIVVCGMISQYNVTERVPGPSNLSNLITKRARMEGFLVFDYRRQYDQALLELGQWLSEGKLQAQYDIVKGLEQTPQAFKRLFDGGNKGKLIVQVAAESS